MQGKVHVAIGTATVACLCVKFPSGLDIAGMHIMPFVALFSASAGSYMPDIDMGTTHAGRQHKIASAVVSKVGGGHRGITHTLLFPVLLFLGLCFVRGFLVDYKYITTVLASLLFGFEVGWLMHIFADLFNGKGCPLLWPIVRTKISIMDLPSSGVVPWIFTAILVGLMGVATFGGLFG